MTSEPKKDKIKTQMARWFRVTCEDTSPLVSELMDHNLSLGKRIRLRIHLGMCGVCQIYKKQLEVIRALARKLGREDAPSRQEAALSDSAKTKIKKALGNQDRA